MNNSPVKIAGMFTPEGGMKINRGTKEQIFRVTASCSEKHWPKWGPQTIVDMLRQMAKEIELYDKHGFQTMRERITTDLINMEAQASISEPASHYFPESGHSAYEMQLVLRLQFL